MTRRRRFVDAPPGQRCDWPVTLRDKTTADCGRKRKDGGAFCWQHQRIVEQLRADLARIGFGRSR